MILEALEDRALPGFLAPVSYPVDVGPTTVAVGDFNGDGKLDLVTANYSSPNYFGFGDVSVLLGNGDGTFQPARNFNTGPMTSFASVAVGDFNGDGKLDIVTTNGSGGSVVLGNGDGTFQSPLSFTLPTEAGYLQTPLSLAVGDLNGDGKLDLVVTGTTYSATYVNMLLGHGDGTFSDAITVQLPSAGIGEQAVALGDFNGDGKLDVVTTTANGVYVLLGNGDGTFGPPTTFATNGEPDSVAVGDFNGDGKLDLVTANYSKTGGSVSVLLGNGDGTFQPARNLLSGLSPAFVAVGDLNYDGKADLVVANSGPNGTGAYVSILLGKGDGTFQSPLNYLAGLSPWSVAAGDFNGDGFPDLAVTNNSSNTVSVLVNAADWSAPQASSFAVSSFLSPSTAGTSGNFIVTARYADGTTDTHYMDTVHFTSSDPQAVLPADYTFTAADLGVHTFSATLKTAGAQSITATDITSGSATGTDAGITVNGSAASTLSVAAFPSPNTAGVAGNFTVMARDPYGNIATSYTGTLHFTSSDSHASLPANYTFTAADAGVHTFSATLRTAGTQSITATDTTTTSITGADAGIVVNPAAASQFIIMAPTSVTAGVQFNLIVKVEDAYGNIATNYTGTIHFSSTDSKAKLPNNYTFTAADGGVHTFTRLVLRTKGHQKITITDTLNSFLFASDIIDAL